MKITTRTLSACVALMCTTSLVWSDPVDDALVINGDLPIVTRTGGVLWGTFANAPVSGRRYRLGAMEGGAEAWWQPRLISRRPAGRIHAGDLRHYIHIAARTA